MGIKKGFLLLVLIDILFGFYGLATFVMTQGPSPIFLLGIAYLFLGFNFIRSSLPRMKLIYFGVIPLTLLSDGFILIWALHKDLSPGWQMPFALAFAFIAIFTGLCLLNVLVFHKIKSHLVTMPKNVIGNVNWGVLFFAVAFGFFIAKILQGVTSTICSVLDIISLVFLFLGIYFYFYLNLKSFPAKTEQPKP